MAGLGRGRGVAALGALALCAGTCARNPVTGKRELALVSEGQEIELGRKAAAEVERSIGLYRAPDLQRYVSEVGERLAARSERPDLPWSFQVVDDPAVNAFALPGGKIFITRGLMSYLNSEAQLAAVLGHEIGHVTARHAVQMLSRAQLAQLGLGIGMILSEDLRQLGGVASAGLGLLFLKYGRDAETQADELGFRYAMGSGYDPRVMTDVFATLSRVSREARGESRLPEWLSTHPYPETRIEKTEARIASLPGARLAGRIARDDYLRRIDGMVFGANPRHGYFEDERFLHPELGFQVTLPAGWQTANLAQAVLAVSPREDAAAEVSLVDEETPEAALRRFSAQPGVTASRGAFDPLPSLSSATASFAADTDRGTLAGLVTYVRFRGRTYQIVGFAVAARLPGYEVALRDVHASFGPLVDPEALAAQPARVDVERVLSPTTLASLLRAQAPSVPVEVVARVNQLEIGSPLEAGRLVKLIEPARGGGAPALR